MTEVKPMTTETAQQAPAQGAQGNEAREAYEAAQREMTDHAIAERVRAAHPHAATSKQAADAMLEDYRRLIAERGAKG